MTANHVGPGGAVAALCIVVIAACGAGTSPTLSTAADTPSARSSAAPASAAAPATGDPPVARMPLLVDTDVAPDDLVALAFLLGSPQVDVEAITVSGTGEAHCEAGTDVVLRLLERLDAPPIDVACGRETPIAGDHAFPEAWRERVDQGSGLDLPATARQPFAGDATALTKATSDRIDGLPVLTLGPLTNLADALRPTRSSPRASARSPSWGARCTCRATCRSGARLTTMSRSGTSTSIRRRSRP